MKYPAIIRNDNEVEMLLLNEDSAIILSEARKGEVHDVFPCFRRRYVDITHEYLSNTWGVVESKEHAELIIELAELHGFKFVAKLKSKCKYFRINESFIGFYEGERGASHSNQKQITIPLPPKEVEAIDEWPKLGGKAVLGGCAVIVNGLHNDLAWCSYMENNECIITTKISNLSKPKSKQDLLIEELQTKLCNNNAVDNYILACDIINGEIEGLSYE